jgi:hypothetical protein
MNDAPSDVTVVWIAPAEGRDDVTRALAEWGRARGISLAAASTVTAPGALRVETGIGERVEREIDRAKEAIASADADAAERALARGEALLRDHPEMPQAAWLRAELSRTWASRFMRVEPRDEARARAAWQDADALDGGRAPGIGETAFPARGNVAVKIVVHGGRNAVLRLDGNPLTPKTSTDTTTTYAIDTPPAEHQLVATASGDAVFASWVAIGPVGATIDVALSSGGSCDATSFAGVSREDTRVVVPPAVTCERWVAALPGEKRGSVLVSRCERDTCGPLLEWRMESLSPSGPPQTGLRRSTWPAWATWTLVGVGAAAAGTIALVASGALESRPTEQRFVAGGVRVESWPRR